MIFKKNIYFYFVCVIVLSICMYLNHVCTWCHGDKERAWDPLEYSFEMVCGC